jgi:hypothetical protein
MEVKANDGKSGHDGQFNGNKKAYGKRHTVGQDQSIPFQHLHFVA